MALYNKWLFTVLIWTAAEFAMGLIKVQRTVPLQSKATGPRGLMAVLGQSPNSIRPLLGHSGWHAYPKLPLWVPLFVFWERDHICINPYWGIMSGAVPIQSRHPLSANQCLCVFGTEPRPCR